MQYCCKILPFGDPDSFSHWNPLKLKSDSDPETEQEMATNNWIIHPYDFWWYGQNTIVGAHLLCPRRSHASIDHLCNLLLLTMTKMWVMPSGCHLILTLVLRAKSIRFVIIRCHSLIFIGGSYHALFYQCHGLQRAPSTQFLSHAHAPWAACSYFGKWHLLKPSSGTGSSDGISSITYHKCFSCPFNLLFHHLPW